MLTILCCAAVLPTNLVVGSSNHATYGRRMLRQRVSHPAVARPSARRRRGAAPRARAAFKPCQRVTGRAALRVSQGKQVQTLLQSSSKLAPNVYTYWIPPPPPLGVATPPPPVSPSVVGIDVRPCPSRSAHTWSCPWQRPFPTPPCVDQDPC